MCLLSYFSHVGLFVTPGTVAHQAPWFIEISRQAYWAGLPCPPSRDLPHPGIKLLSPVIPALQVESLLLSHQGSPDISTPPTHTNSSYISLSRIQYLRRVLFSGKIYKQWNPHNLWTTQWILANTYNCITQPLVKESTSHPTQRQCSDFFMVN